MSDWQYWKEPGFPKHECDWSGCDSDPDHCTIQCNKATKWFIEQNAALRRELDNLRRYDPYVDYADKLAKAEAELADANRWGETNIGEYQAKLAAVERELAGARKELERHQNCVTPCDSIRIQQDNHNAYLDMKSRADDAERRAALLENAFKDLAYGCGNHSCRIKKPTGMATNGPCQCLDVLRAKLSALDSPRLSDGAEKPCQDCASRRTWLDNRCLPCPKCRPDGACAACGGTGAASCPICLNRPAPSATARAKEGE